MTTSLLRYLTTFSCTYLSAYVPTYVPTYSPTYTPTYLPLTYARDIHSTHAPMSSTSNIQIATIKHKQHSNSNSQAHTTFK